MTPRTFKRHIRAILQRNNLAEATMRTNLPEEVIRQIVDFMGDTNDMPGSKTISELARDYKVSRKTLIGWIEPINHTLKAKVRGKYILSASDLSQIFNFLGRPEDY